MATISTSSIADHIRQNTSKSFVRRAVFTRFPSPSMAAMSIASALLTALLTAAPAGKASAQGFFDLFGGSRALSSETASSGHALGYASPAEQQAPRSPAPQRSASTGRSTSYCVRTCDGRHFPIQHNVNASPVQLCNALCPAAETKIFSGSEISRAVAKDGTRYTALENAFAYRTRIVSNCTCNGKDSFGVASIAASADPTLRRGDIVATAENQIVPSAAGAKR